MGVGEGDKLSALGRQAPQALLRPAWRGCCRPRVFYKPVSRAKWRRPLIEIALEATGGNQAKCADLLGINRNTLRKKIH